MIIIVFPIASGLCSVLCALHGTSRSGSRLALPINANFTIIAITLIAIIVKLALLLYLSHCNA